jgi:hypothetical protein
LAQQDLSIADALVKPIVSGAVASEPQVKESASMASAMLQIRQVNLFTQIKGQVLGGSEMTEEEKARCAECLAAAQKLAPEHESVKTMEADLLAVDGKLDETLTIVETLIAKAEPNDGVPYVIKANYIGQKVRLFLSVFWHISRPILILSLSISSHFSSNLHTGIFVSEQAVRAGTHRERAQGGGGGGKPVLRRSRRLVHQGAAD